MYILTLHVYLHIKHKQHKHAQNARHAAMRLVAQPQLTRTDLHEILRNPGRKGVNRKRVSLWLSEWMQLYIKNINSNNYNKVCVLVLIHNNVT